MGVYRLPSMAESDPATPTTPDTNMSERSQTCLVGITIFIEDKRLRYRPTLWPTMKTTDLEIDIYMLIKYVFREANYSATDLKGLLKDATDALVLVRLQGPRGFYIRTLTDVEEDADLWEEVLDYEFPLRHEVEPLVVTTKSRKRGREEDVESETPSSKRVRMTKPTTGILGRITGKQSTNRKKTNPSALQYWS